MKIGGMIEQLADSEHRLADRLLEVADRHRADHDVYHLTKTLAKLEQGHLDTLAAHAKRYRAAVRTPTGEPGVTQTPTEEGSTLLDRRAEPGLVLLHDLREVHLLAVAASLDWTALGQAAQAARDEDLLSAVSAAHAQTLRTLKWTTYRLKEAAPQALTA
jgi:hypothetical protein